MTNKNKISGTSCSRVSNENGISAVEKFHSDLMLIFAKHYSQTLSENIKRGIRAKKERELAKKLSTSTASQVNESKV